MERKFYDPEYDRIVDESVPKKQYAWFSAQSWQKISQSLNKGALYER